MTTLKSFLNLTLVLGCLVYGCDEDTAYKELTPEEAARIVADAERAANDGTATEASDEEAKSVLAEVERLRMEIENADAGTGEDLGPALAGGACAIEHGSGRNLVALLAVALLIVRRKRRS